MTHNRFLSEWLVAVKPDGLSIAKAAFTLTSKVPEGVLKTTQYDKPDTDFIVYWYLNLPHPELESLMPDLIAKWLSEGRLR